jgi:transaldolase/glucose-6-phosphate isomerase
MSDNPLVKVGHFGQSIWLDFLRRDLYTTDKLQRLIDEDGLRGMTSNPAIFDEAITGSDDYDHAIRVLALEGKDVGEIYETLVVSDVQHATDVFRPTYQEAGGHDGLVSLEVSPQLAHDTEATIAEARRLWAAVERPNVMIKVPATLEGLPAIRQLISEGINVNVTLLFGLPRYRQVVEAYIAGLEARLEAGREIDHIASVASFFLSRIDVLIDPWLEELMQGDEPKASMAKDLHGQVAIASAKVAYQIYKEIFEGERFERLAQHGAHTQRLLWASTSTKNPDYSDVKYVEALIGPETVNTVPFKTLDAYRDHGKPAVRIEEALPEARDVLRQLDAVGIDLDAATQELEDEGVAKFVMPYNQLMETLAEQRRAAVNEPVDSQTLTLEEDEAAVKERLADLEGEPFIEQLWRMEPSLWKKDLQDQAVIASALGWLHVPDKMEEAVDELEGFCGQLHDAGMRHVVHMGMGGSSLAPLVFQRTFSPAGNACPLTVLDTTDPATIRQIEETVPLTDTLFIVASKSGTTTETLSYGDYFYSKLQDLKGGGAGGNMASITDPGSPLVDLARERGYRKTFLNFTDIGGRYSALSYFGLLPASLMGVDVNELLVRALRMRYACSPEVPPSENPGLALGATLGELGLRGRNKVTFLMPEALATFGMWLEQLLAESTGKEGTGLLPVTGEPIGDPSVYGDDRLFVHFRLKDNPDETLDRGVDALSEAGHPVVTIEMRNLLDLGQEFFRWEIATAIAGAILGINAFDQPNVQESKDNTDRLLNVYRKQEQLPEEDPALVEEPLKWYAEDDGHRSIAEALAAFFEQAQPGDYVALMAYLTEEPDAQQVLQEIRVHLRDRLQLATTLGYGPRFLHSTGQLHKGGPNTGLFLQLTADDTMDVGVPGEPYSFGTLKRAQALGDLESLRKHERRVVRIHLGSDIQRGLAALEGAIKQAT